MSYLAYTKRNQNQVVVFVFVYADLLTPSPNPAVLIIDFGSFGTGFFLITFIKLIFHI